MDPRAYEYLGFEWAGIFYDFLSATLWFGHRPLVFYKSYACRFFPRASQGLLSKGLRPLTYQDNFLFLVTPACQSVKHRDIVFESAGFSINAAKSHRTSPCHFLICNNKLDYITKLSPGLRSELQFWPSISRTHSSTQIWPPPFSADISIFKMPEVKLGCNLG
jgi:hypothetical protein